MSKATERSAARLAAVQAIYQMDLAGKGVVDVAAEFEAHWIGREIDGVAFNASDVPFFRDILAGVVREQRPIDAKVDGALAAGWPLKRIETVLRAILRAGAFELLFRRDVPAKVTINEYVEIAHSFYSEDEPGLVNGVLDAIARETRADELVERGKGRV
ncbi:MAG: transcription antitermination factor NusB [Salinarimonadaceae bacterium]|nr:MAG: transcription antitermination factor NusB [Salinarimonadaceae bacterium]